MFGMKKPGRTIWRYELPVDSKAHHFELNDYPTRVETLLFKPATYKDKGWFLEFWAMRDPNEIPMILMLQGFATGEEIPPGAYVLGTAAAVHRRVFHLVALNTEGEQWQ